MALISLVQFAERLMKVATRIYSCIAYMQQPEMNSTVRAAALDAAVLNNPVFRSHLMRGLLIQLQAWTTKTRLRMNGAHASTDEMQEAGLPHTIGEPEVMRLLGRAVGPLVVGRRLRN